MLAAMSESNICKQCDPCQCQSCHNWPSSVASGHWHRKSW